VRPIKLLRSEHVVALLLWAPIAMVETLDGLGRLGLTTFHTPLARGGDRHAPATRPISAVRHGTATLEAPR
jgi:hypothetical protein